MRPSRWITAIGSFVAASALMSGTAQAAAPIIPASDFMTQSQIRAKLDFDRALSDYYLSETDQSPIADPDCATANLPQATWAVVHPASRDRFQTWTYEVPKVSWYLGGSVTIYEYSSKTKARKALKRVKASVRSASGYTVVCEAVNLKVSGQVVTAGLGLRGADFAWASHLRAFDANSCRFAVSQKGKRLVWIELCRTNPATSSTSHPDFPRYPSAAYFRGYAKGAARAAL